MHSFVPDYMYLCVNYAPPPSPPLSYTMNMIILPTLFTSLVLFSLLVLLDIWLNYLEEYNQHPQGRGLLMQEL